MDFRVGIKGIVRVDDKVLVLRKVEAERAFWDVPGGRIDDDESIEITLRREIAEELPSLHVFEVGGLLHAFRLGRNPEGKGLILLFYSIITKTFDVEISSEHKEYRWVSKDEVEELRTTPETTLDPGTYAALVQAFK